MFEREQADQLIMALIGFLRNGSVSDDDIVMTLSTRLMRANRDNQVPIGACRFTLDEPHCCELTHEQWEAFSQADRSATFDAGVLCPVELLPGVEGPAKMRSKQKKVQRKKNE